MRLKAPCVIYLTVFDAIHRGQLDTLAMPAIPKDDSDRLEAQRAEIELRLASALGENCTLAAARNALLPQLMSGKLRVRDAEKAVETGVSMPHRVVMLDRALSDLCAKCHTVTCALSGTRWFDERE